MEKERKRLLCLKPQVPGAKPRGNLEAAKDAPIRSERIPHKVPVVRSHHNKENMVPGNKHQEKRPTSRRTASVVNSFYSKLEGLMGDIEKFELKKQSCQLPQGFLFAEI